MEARTSCCNSGLCHPAIDTLDMEAPAEIMSESSALPSYPTWQYGLDDDSSHSIEVAPAPDTAGATISGQSSPPTRQSPMASPAVTASASTLAQAPQRKSLMASLLATMQPTHDTQTRAESVFDVLVASGGGECTGGVMKDVLAASSIPAGLLSVPGEPAASDDPAFGQFASTEDLLMHAAAGADVEAAEHGHGAGTETDTGDDGGPSAPASRRSTIQASALVRGMPRRSIAQSFDSLRIPRVESELMKAAAAATTAAAAQGNDKVKVKAVGKDEAGDEVTLACCMGLGSSGAEDTAPGTSWDAWMWAVVVVLGGQLYGWNSAFAAGFGSYFTAQVVVALAFVCLIFCIGENTAALAFPGGAYGLARYSPSSRLPLVPSFHHHRPSVALHACRRRRVVLGFYAGAMVGYLELTEYLFMISAAAFFIGQTAVEAIGCDPAYQVPSGPSLQLQRRGALSHPTSALWPRRSCSGSRSTRSAWPPPAVAPPPSSPPTPRCSPPPSASSSSTASAAFSTLTCGR